MKSSVKGVFLAVLVAFSVTATKEAVLAGEGYRSVDIHDAHIYNLADGRVFLEVKKVGEEYECHYYIGESLWALTEIEKGEEWIASNAKCGCEKMTKVVSGTFTGENPPSCKDSCEVPASQCIYKWAEQGGKETFAIEMTDTKKRNYTIKIRNGEAAIYAIAIPDAVIRVEKLWGDFIRGTDRCSVVQEILYAMNVETEIDTRMDILRFRDYLKDGGVDLNFIYQYSFLHCAK